MSLAFTYAGTVENNQDPLKLGRLKVRVPHVWGSSSTGSGYIPTNDLPWALPAGMPAGGSSASGGFSQLPAVGDSVWVRFLDGEPEKPIWEWGMQTQDQSKALKLHEYAATQDSGQSVTGLPDRAIITRYGHSLEIKENTVTLTTKEGYQVVLGGSGSDSGGSVALQTPSGQSISLNDTGQSVVSQALDANVVSGKTVILNGAESILAKTSRFTLAVGTSLITLQDETVTINTATGAAILIDDQGNISVNSGDGSTISLEDGKVQLGTADGSGIVIELGQISVNALQFVLNTTSCALGTEATFPVVMMTAEMLAFLLTHTHTNGNNGSPTGPPIGFQTLGTTAASKTTRTT
jgi:hypothetical protein